MLEVTVLADKHLLQRIFMFHVQNRVCNWCSPMKYEGRRRQQQPLDVAKLSGDRRQDPRLRDWLC